MPDDIELLRRASRGDDAAFQQILQQHGRYLFGIAHAMTHNTTDAEDVVQEALISALRGEFRGESSLRTWLVKILVRRAAMHRRSTRRREARVILGTKETGESPDSSVRSDAGAVDARIDLSQMLTALSADHRAVIVLRELEGLSYDEISEALHVPVGTVESRLHRAREDLRRKFPNYARRD